MHCFTPRVLGNASRTLFVKRISQTKLRSHNQVTILPAKAHENTQLHLACLARAIVGILTVRNRGSSSNHTLTSVEQLMNLAFRSTAVQRRALSAANMLFEEVRKPSRNQSSWRQLKHTKRPNNALRGNVTAKDVETWMLNSKFATLTLR